jgi:hypothetical protein
MLSDDDIREQLSIAYIHAVASRAGYAWERTSIDRDGVDGRIHARGLVDRTAVLRSPHIALQLKATTTLSGDADPMSYPLKQKNYDDLRGRCAEPRYLALLVMPADEKDWLHLGPDALVLRRCMYWHSLRDAPDSGNETATTVHVSRANVLDVDALKRLIAAAAREEAL